MRDEKTLSEVLISIGACRPAKAWLTRLKNKTPVRERYAKFAYEKCNNGVWLRLLISNCTNAKQYSDFVNEYYGGNLGVDWSADGVRKVVSWEKMEEYLRVNGHLARD